MREVQGGIIGSGLIIAFLGMSGAIKPLLRLVGPITAAVNIGTLVRHDALHKSALLMFCSVNETPD